VKYRNQRARYYSDLEKANKQILESAGKRYDTGARAVTDRHDIEWSKVLGLYGGGVGLAGYGAKKAFDKKSET
jgi:hypothetical protein